MRRAVAEHHGHQSRENYLPFVFEAMYEAGAEKAANRVGQRNKERIQQAMGDADGKAVRAASYQNQRSRLLEEVHHHQHDGAFAVPAQAQISLKAPILR